jgi:ABC-type multidrug transport system ATPase subunit
MGDPELIVLDEPTNGLDPAGMADMRALIVDLARGGQTVLLSSHLLAEVEEICDRVGVIARGTLLVESTVSELRGGRRLRVVATPVDQALAVAMRIVGDDAVHLEGDAVLLDVLPERTPEVVRALVDAGLDVHEATISERTLEDVFFEMTDTGLRTNAPTANLNPTSLETVR